MDEPWDFFPYLMRTCIIISIVVLSLTVSVVLYRIVRPLFSVTVNCWFCNKNSNVPFGNRSCWDCPFCEQYNGFKQDGDYNKAIPSQQKEDLNHPVCIENKPSSSGVKKTDSVLCESCNRNQLLKTKQLANFVPYSEENYGMEVEAYKHHLEQIYRLCKPCQVKVDQVLEKQNARLKKELNLSSHLFTPDSSSSLLETSLCSSHVACRLATPRHVKLLRWSSLLCALSLCVTAVLSLLEHSDWVLQPSQWLPGLLMVYLTALHNTAHLLILLGFIALLLAIYRFGKHSLHVCDAVSCLTWLLVLAVYSNFLSKKLATEDVYLLQALCAAVNMAVAVWGIACPRFQPSPTRIYKKKRKFNTSNTAEKVDTSLEGSVMDSGQSMSSHNTAPKTTSTKQNKNSEPLSGKNAGDSSNTEVMNVDKFETMSLGSPGKRKAPPKQGIFTIKNGSQSSSSTESTSAWQPSLQSLKKKRSLISPAKFVPKFQKLAVPAGNQQFSVTSTQGKPGFFPTASHDNEDRPSLFSVPSVPENKPQDDNSESEERQSSSRTTDSYCPVESTGDCGEEVECQLDGTAKRSLLTKVVLGVSLGMNIALILYFILDSHSLPMNVDGFKQVLVKSTDVLCYLGDAVRDKCVVLAKLLYVQVVNALVSLTQEIPAASEDSNEETVLS